MFRKEIRARNRESWVMVYSLSSGYILNQLFNLFKLTFLHCWVLSEVVNIPSNSKIGKFLLSSILYFCFIKSKCRRNDVMLDVEKCVPMYTHTVSMYKERDKKETDKVKARDAG